MGCTKMSLELWLLNPWGGTISLQISVFYKNLLRDFYINKIIF